MAVESALLVTIGTSLASALLKSVMQKSVDSLSKTSSVSALKSAIFGNLKPQILHLQRELTKLDALLRCAEIPNPVVQHNQNDLLLLWLKRVKEAANYADNLLEDISYDQLRRQAESNIAKKLLHCGSNDSFVFRAKIGSKLSKFKAMTTEIYKEAAEIGIRPVDFSANPASFQPHEAMCTDLREIRENVDTSTVVGRQADEDLIVRELSRPNNDQILGIIAIVGMSGVGKSTLARKVYDNQSVTKIYKQKAWIVATKDFNLKRFLDEMLQSLTGVSHKLSNTEALEKKFRECLQKERYLLVLDDVWNTDKLVWDSIRSSLVRVTNGCTYSKVLVTTQSSEVALVMGAYLTHKVEVLSNNDAWALFEGKTFANKSKEQVLELRDIGERIVRKCGGLPLAINTLASLLASMDERSQWESVDRSQLWKLSEGQIKIMPWLLLSFNHLPNAAIKRCFAYCPIVIPKGTNFIDEMLIDCWIDQEFIQPSETTEYASFSDIGRMYFKCLLANNLLQSTECTEPKLFTMHDLFHDLALYVSMDSSLIISDSNDLHKASFGVEHISIYGGNTCNSLLNFPDGNIQNTLRTLICFNLTISIDLVAQARFLRHLHLIRCGLKEIPSSIGRLKHLRTLDLDDNPFEYLPEAIGRLYNLRFMHLRNCCRLVELPQQVTKLFNLTEISTTEAVYIPKGMGQLTQLMFFPGVKLKARDGCKITELRSLIHLRGKVSIMQLENTSSKEDVDAVLKNKQKITDLKLVWTSEGLKDDIVCRRDEELMEGLQPHSNLEVLRMENFRGKRFSPWLSNGYCNNLTRLTLVNCKRCEQLPSLGCLQRLKYLSIDGMESVEVIGIAFFACSSTGSSHSDSVSGMSQRDLFPRLEEFHLLNMLKLKEWFDPLGSCASSFPCLEKLFIKNCPSLVRVPTCFHSLKELGVGGINSGEPLLVILSNSCNLTSLTVQNVQQLTCLSEPLLKCIRLRLLRIKYCDELVELPDTLQSLGCLESFEVGYCKSLTSLPDIKGLLSLSKVDILGCENITDPPSGVESCVSLENLSLYSCPKLKLIPDLQSLCRLQVVRLCGFSEQMSIPRWTNQLSSLHLMTIGVFTKELDNFHGFHWLPKCLKALILVGWIKLKSLPDELQSLTQLRSLGLWHFEGVVALPEWLGNLTSLDNLEIWDCKNIKHLPSSDAMRRLNQLTRLRIEGCPELEERCKEEGGEEWPKISHLPTILIGTVEATNYKY